MAGEKLARDIAVRDRERTAIEGGERAESLRFAAAAMEEILRYPFGGPVDMLEVRKGIARRMGIEDPEYTGGYFPEIEDKLERAKAEVTAAADREEGIAGEAAHMACQLANGELSLQD